MKGLREQNFTFSGEKITLLGEEVKKGDIAKDFVVIDHELKHIKLSDFKNEIKVISVFPSIDTGVCAFQVTWFNKEVIKYKNVKLLTISVDLPFALDRFCIEHDIKNSYTLSDYKDLDFGLKYGFVIEELRLLSRGIIIIDENNKISYIEYVKEITKHPDYEKAIEELEKIIKKGE